MLSIYIASISSFSVVFPLLLVLFSGKRNLKDPIFIALGILLLASGLSDAGEYALREMDKPHLLVANCYTIIEFLLFSYIYSRVLPNKKWVYGGLIIFTIFFSINLLFIQPFTEFQGWLNFVEGIILLSYACLSSFHLIKTADGIPLFDRLTAWINLVVLTYFLLNLGTFSLRELVFEDLPAGSLGLAWNFHNATNILKNILLAVGIYYSGRKGGDKNILKLKEITDNINKRHNIAMSDLERTLKELRAE